MKQLTKWVGRVAALGALLALAFVFKKNYGTLPPFAWSGGSLFVLALAVAYWIVTTVLAAHTWKTYLATRQIFISEKNAYWVVGSSQIAKYLPGNVFQYVGQVALSRRLGLPREPVISGIVVQTIATVAAALLLSVIGIGSDSTSAQLIIPVLGSGLIPVIVIASAVCIFVILFIFSKKLSRAAKKWLTTVKLSNGAYTTVLILISFLGSGLLLRLLATSLWPSAEPVSWFTFAWGFALAWVAGFVVPGAPGGLGIREAVFSALFAPAMGAGLAIGLIVLVRVLSSISDFLAFAIATTLRPRDLRDPTELS